MKLLLLLFLETTSLTGMYVSNTPSPVIPSWNDILLVYVDEEAGLCRLYDQNGDLAADVELISSGISTASLPELDIELRLQQRGGLSLEVLGLPNNRSLYFHRFQSAAAIAEIPEACQERVKVLDGYPFFRHINFMAQDIYCPIQSVQPGQLKYLKLASGRIITHYCED